MHISYKIHIHITHAGKDKICQHREFIDSSVVGMSSGQDHLHTVVQSKTTLHVIVCGMGVLRRDVVSMDCANHIGTEWVGIFTYHCTQKYHSCPPTVGCCQLLLEVAHLQSKSKSHFVSMYKLINQPRVLQWIKLCHCCIHELATRYGSCLGVPWVYAFVCI